MSTEWQVRKQQLHRFFYEEEVPFALAMMRMAFPVVMLCMVIPRWPVARELFSADGAPSQLSVGFGHGNLFPVFSGEVVVALMSLLVFTLVTSSIGWCTRVSLFVTWVLFTYFAWMDSVSTTTKYTSIATHFFLLLAVSPCGAVWSVDAWLAHYRRNDWPGSPSIDRPRFPVWPRRLLQFFLGTVYFGAAITKLQTPSFLTGDELQAWMMTHINYRHPIGEYLAMYPALLVVGCYAALIWEVLFIFLIWEKKLWRPIILAVGVCFHFMTTLTLGLLIFPATCYSLYLAFVEPEDVQHAAATFRRFCRRFTGLRHAVARAGALLTAGNPVGWRKPAQIGFAAVAAIAVAIGMAAEYQMDPMENAAPKDAINWSPLTRNSSSRCSRRPLRYEISTSFSRLIRDR
ncbi:MAG: HTTM domain-containing protein [Planctomycetaceae bacterium]